MEVGGSQVGEVTRLCGNPPVHKISHMVTSPN